MEHLAEVREDAASANQQALEDIAYSRLPETLAEYKEKRVPARDYVPVKCRVYGMQLSSGNSLRAHLGYSKRRGKHTINCHKCKVSMPPQSTYKGYGSLIGIRNLSLKGQRRRMRKRKRRSL